MSGFKDDVVSILKHNNMFHKESKGLLVGIKDTPKVRELMAVLDEHNLLSTGRRHPALRWDYIVVPYEKLSTRTVLQSLAELSNMGILIVEITGKDEKFANKYRGISTINNIHATKVFYNERAYLVFHPGGEYGH